MFLLLQTWLGLLALTAALPADVSHFEKRGGSGYNPPRSVIYVQTFKTTSGGKLSLLPIVQQNTRATHVYLASTHINADPNGITLNDNSPDDAVYDSVWSDAATLQQSGVKVMMMLGGAAPGSYPRLCSGSNGAVNDTYYTPLRDILRKHKVDGIDLDIEEQVPYTCPLNLLRRFYQDFGKDFILTMAPVASELQPVPYGLGGFSYSLLDSQATASDKPNGKLVDWFNAQFYNGWGDASSPNGYNAIILNGYYPSRVALGVLDSKNDGGSGWYSLSTYAATISTLKQNYNNFGGDVGWEYWDAGISEAPALQNPWQWVKTIGNAIFDGTAAQKNLNTTVDDAPSPWPALTEEIVKLSGSAGKPVPWLGAVQALNRTDGSLVGALNLLGLGYLSIGRAA
ncbi:glycoside hydrolase family 18 protein [Dothistroma septosporum NZE10]|uniref:chitinase n=1 Tax=Dothistroma septosporum (strain NZE10 / CBS 128990) TaxID=675120 RepID=N1PR43_DOTSN|nr:glycoside hydrolase family 18 protein [Dothistroma septosporum NZE10]